MAEESRCGFVALVGRPNVGKSTLLNHLMGKKIAITSRHPQTTRHRLTGVCTLGHDQVLFVDTPGLHRSGGRAIDRYMNRVVGNVLADVDVVVMVVDRDYWLPADEFVLEQIQKSNCAVLLAINKTDLMQDKKDLLPCMQGRADAASWVAIIPVAALKGHGLPALMQEVRASLPVAPHLFPASQVTDRSDRFLAAEIVREQIVRQIGDEIPYRTAVQTEHLKEVASILHIRVLVVVERAGQKAILIGKGGHKMKTIGQSARVGLEKLFQRQVMLRIWVKVRRGWSNRIADLQALDYDER